MNVTPLPTATAPRGAPAYVDAFIDLAGWSETEVPDRHFLVPGLIPDRCVTSLYGDGGSGKGWRQKEPLDAYAAAARIGRTSPETALQLQTWLGQAKAATGFHPAQLAASQTRWAQQAPIYSARVDPALASAFYQKERLSSGDRLARYREGQRAAGLAAEATPRPAPARQGLLAAPGPPARGLLGAER